MVGWLYWMVSEVVDQTVSQITGQREITSRRYYITSQRLF